VAGEGGGGEVGAGDVVGELGEVGAAPGAAAVGGGGRTRGGGRRGSRVSKAAEKQAEQGLADDAGEGEMVML
jgi:hypothetical protein